MIKLKSLTLSLLICFLLSGCSRWMRYNLEGALNNLPKEKITIVEITNNYIQYQDIDNGTYYKAYYADDGEIIKTTKE